MQRATTLGLASPLHSSHAVEFKRSEFQIGLTRYDLDNQHP